MNSSYVIPFSLTKSWILLFLFPLFQRFLSSTHFSPQLYFMAVTLGFCYLPAYAPPWLHPLYSFSIFSSVKYDPSLPPIIFLLSTLHAAVLFSLVLWFQLKAFFYFHCIPCKSLLIHPIPLLKSPMSPFCVQSAFLLQLTLHQSLLSCIDFHQPYSQISDAVFLPFKQRPCIFQLHT